MNVVRLGRPVNVRSSLWNHTVDARLQQRNSWIRARAGLDKAVIHYSSLKEAGVSGEEFGKAQRRLKAAKDDFQRVESRCVSDVLRGAQVVVTSCIGRTLSISKKYAKRRICVFLPLYFLPLNFLPSSSSRCVIFSPLVH